MRASLLLVALATLLVVVLADFDRVMLSSASYPDAVRFPSLLSFPPVPLPPHPRLRAAA